MLEVRPRPAGTARPKARAGDVPAAGATIAAGDADRLWAPVTPPATAPQATAPQATAPQATAP